MTAITTDARQAIITALSGVAATVYDTVPPAPIPPAVVVAPDSPWFVPATIGNRLRGELRLRCMCVTRDGQGGIDRLESLIEAVMSALPDGVAVDEVSPPQSTDLGAQGSALMSEIAIRLHIKES